MMKKTQSAGGIVLNQKGEVLIVNQNANSWSFPKGHIEPGEDPLTAAHREIYEETGIVKLQLIKPLGKYERYKISLTSGDDRSELKEIFMFLFMTRQRKLQPLDPTHPEARWVSFQKGLQLLTHPKDRKFLTKVFPPIKQSNF